MPEFLELSPVEDAQLIFKNTLQVNVKEEEILTQNAVGRITTNSIAAPHPLPSFTRSSVDGYALKASDAFGASDALPAYLKLIGEISMGVKPNFSLAPAQCCLIHTGGMLPAGADAVVMLEHTQISRPEEIEVYRAVAFGENVIREGEDVKASEVVVQKGTRLRPAEIGGLMSLGIVRVKVACKPRVAVISSGDEIVPPESKILPGKIRDTNSYSLSALVEEAGGTAIRYGIVPDDFDVLYQVASQAIAECDLVVITAGSSASARDFTAQVINQLGKPGVLVHGINIKPGKPTILGICQGKAVVGLPGNPVSALIIARHFLVPVINLLTGLREDFFQHFIYGKLTLNLSSQAGREDWIPVHVEENQSEYTAEPVFGKSNLIFTLARSNGLICIPADTTGLNAGEIVKVYTY